MRLFVSVIFLVSSLVTFTLGVDINLEVFPKKVNINQILTAKVRVETNDSSPVKIVGIKGLENFVIVENQNFFSQYTHLEEVNGKIIQKNVISQILVLKLKPKKSGKFIFGPVFVKYKGKIYKSGFEQVEVTGQKIFISNNGFSLLKNFASSGSNFNSGFSSSSSFYGSSNILKSGNGNNFTNTSINLTGNEQVLSEADNFDWKLVFIFLILILGTFVSWWAFLVISKDEKKQRNLVKNNSNLDNGLLASKVAKENNLFFGIEENNIIKQADYTLRKMLENKIPGVYSKTYSEILEFVDDEDIKELIYLLQQTKYSNKSSSELIDKILSILERLKNKDEFGKN